MKKFTVTKTETDRLILSYKDDDKNVSIDELATSFTVDDILYSFYKFSSIVNVNINQKNIIRTKICNGYFPHEFLLYDSEKLTKKMNIVTLDDIYLFLYRYNIDTDSQSIYVFLNKKYPTIELYGNSLGYLIMVIENIIQTKRVLTILRKCGFHLINDYGNVVEVEAKLKKIVKRYTNNI